MGNSRDTILRKLKAAQKTAGVAKAATSYLPVVPLQNTSPEGMLLRFVEQAEKLECIVYQPTSNSQVLDILIEIIGDDLQIQVWDLEHISLPDLDRITAKVPVVDPHDASVRVGITGADAGLASTGSLVLMSGAGKHRLTSLLPPVHVAVLRKSDIVADLETWITHQRKRGLDAFQQTSSTIVISGPSRTADIAMQLILGMHGPEELHIILVD